MKMSIRGDKIKVTKAIKDYIDQKIGKLDKYFESPKEMQASVVIKVKQKNQTVEVTIPMKKFTIRAEETHNDLYAAIDLIVDKLERLIRKNKTRLEKQYKDAPLVDMNFDFEEEKEEKEETIIKRKNIESKPMDEDEALLQMKLLNHDFFAFKNLDEECVSVMYLRKDGKYGIINIK